MFCYYLRADAMRGGYVTVNTISFLHNISPTIVPMKKQFITYETLNSNVNALNTASK